MYGQNEYTEQEQELLGLTPKLLSQSEIELIESVGGAIDDDVLTVMVLRKDEAETIEKGRANLAEYMSNYNDENKMLRTGSPAEQPQAETQAA